MTTTKNNEHKKLNFSSEREQSQACLNSAEHEKNQGRKVLNVPNLRFPEFQGEWEKCTLSEVCKFHNGRAYKQSELLAAGKYRILRVGNFFTNDSWYYSNLELEDNKYAQDGDLLYAWSASFGPRFWKEEKVIYHYHIWKIDSFKNVDKEFMYHFLDLDSSKIKNEVQGGTMVHITKGNMEKRTISYPSINEQKKIAKLLSLLDECIATQNKIIDKLQSLINGLRVCLIQKENGNIVHLGEIAQIYQPQTISSTELTEDGFLVYGANGIIGKYKKYNHKTEQICITCRGNTCGMVNYTKPMSWITGNAMVINTDAHQDKVCKRYLYHYLSAYNFNRIISGSGQPQIVRTPLEQLKVTLPTISEQKQKAMFLDKIQDKIDLNHKVLNLYIRQKQYLLRQMFI